MPYHKPMTFFQKDLISSLFIGLGQTNIDTITHCMSRIRITVHDPSLLAPDLFFLSLNTKGIVRNQHSIQLIYGQESPFLASFLKFFTSSFQDLLSSEIIYLCQGVQNIKTIEYQDKKILLTLSQERDFGDKLHTLAQQYHFTYQYTPPLLLFSDLPQDFTTLFQYKIDFWVTIQTFFILSQIPIDTIVQITTTQHSLKITLDAHYKIDPNLWVPYGLSITYNPLDHHEIFIQYYNEELFSTIQRYYQFLKNSSELVDNI